MSFFYPELEIPPKVKNIPHHPWEKIIKDVYAGTYKYAHNSAKNPVYPPPKKGKVPCSNRVKFTVIGTRTEKEFIYCMNLVKGLHKYRWRHFDAPVITAVTSGEWIKTWNNLKIQYGGEAYCLKTQVAVIINEQFLGGGRELKELIESKYIYHLNPDYYVETVKLCSNFIKSSGRPFPYLEIMINGRNIGMMTFMLYSDIVPRTCENFLRLCKETRGGYSGTPIHRIVKDSWIQCGGFGLKETDLSCENFIVPHDRRGVIAMANDGRHVDCSTQFFVLLQPQDWMAFKYVAFGQLISGEETLKMIEQVPAWYESPKKDIIIAKAGIINLECQDITINKGTNKYIEGHKENLIIIGEMFYEALLEKVFLEVELRTLQRIQAEMFVGEGEITPEEVTQNLRATQRFMRRKEDIIKQIEKPHIDRSGKATSAATVEKSENNDFDVEEYEYVPEEYTYQHVSASASGSFVVKPEKPFYIPLTDVPYPGEVSSEFDLKRLLQGDYCLESDLNKEAGKTKKKTDEDRLMFHSDILAEVFDLKSPESESSENSLNSEDERQIKQYLQDNVDRVSFAGEVIKTIAKSAKFTNIFEAHKLSDLVSDELLRKYRMAEEIFRRGREKIATEHHDIPKNADPSAKVPRVIGVPEPRKAGESPGGVGRKSGSNFRETRFSDLVDNEELVSDFADGKRRMSVLKRLIDDMASDEGPGPTLKDYKPLSEQEHKKTLFLLTYSPEKHADLYTPSDDPREVYLRRRKSITMSMPRPQDQHKSIEHILGLQHGKTVYRKISTDYVKTIDQMEQKQDTSLRSLEYAKHRPAISVKEYQKKNREYNERLERSSKLSKVNFIKRQEKGKDM